MMKNNLFDDEYFLQKQKDKLLLTDEEFFQKYNVIEKRPYCNKETHSKEALNFFLLSDDIVPDRTDSLFATYPFLKNKIKSNIERHEYDNATYYENARWLILTMSDIINKLLVDNANK